jgi:hypothetical protein
MGSISFELMEELLLRSLLVPLDVVASSEDESLLADGFLCNVSLGCLFDRNPTAVTIMLVGSLASFHLEWMYKKKLIWLLFIQFY